MSGYVPVKLRRFVVRRASGLCEYCLVHEDDTFFGCQIEHVISEKHGGPTAPQNLAYACVFCNRFKGSDIGSISPRTGQLCRFFNPRIDEWSDHFSLEGVVIRPRTEIGEVTALILALNHIDRLVERQALDAVGRYPSPAARKRLRR
jgi:hypothetical protein